MNSSELKSAINQALDKVRPVLQQDGGDVKFVAFDEISGALSVRFTGHCAGCPYAQMTLRQTIEKTVRENVSAVKSIRLAEPI